MFFWKPTLITGCALGTLISVGVVNTATGGHSYHRVGSPESHQQLPHDAEYTPGQFKHPVYGHTFKHPVYGSKFKHPKYGYMFKHPVYGYKFKHPVHGYIRISTDEHNLVDPSPAAMEREEGSASTR